MFCRNCGYQVFDPEEICPKCGVRPLKGKAHCQDCGAKTSQLQELCVECGKKLKSHSIIPAIEWPLIIAASLAVVSLLLPWFHIAPYDDYYLWDVARISADTATGPSERIIELSAPLVLLLCLSTLFIWASYLVSRKRASNYKHWLIVGTLSLPACSLTWAKLIDAFGYAKPGLFLAAGSLTVASCWAFSMAFRARRTSLIEKLFVVSCAISTISLFLPWLKAQSDGLNLHMFWWEVAKSSIGYFAKGGHDIWVRVIIWCSVLTLSTLLGLAGYLIAQANSLVFRKWFFLGVMLLPACILAWIELGMGNLSNKDVGVYLACGGLLVACTTAFILALRAKEISIVEKTFVASASLAAISLLLPWIFPGSEHDQFFYINFWETSTFAYASFLETHDCDAITLSLFGSISLCISTLVLLLGYLVSFASLSMFRRWFLLGSAGILATSLAWMEFIEVSKFATTGLYILIGALPIACATAFTLAIRSKRPLTP